MKVVNFTLLLFFSLAKANVYEEGLRLLNSTENFENCGISSNTQISNGQEVEVHSRPWMALINVTLEDGGIFQCGGTLISKRFVLTTARCTDKRGTKMIQVRLGDHHLTETGYCHKDTCEKGHIDIGVEKTISSNRLFIQRIALIKLARDVEFNDQIRPICLPISPELMEPNRRTFGLTSWKQNEYAELSKVLLESTVLRSLCWLGHRYIQCSKSGSNETRLGFPGDPLMYPVSYYGSQRFVQFEIVCYEPMKFPEWSPLESTNIAADIPWIIRNMFEL